ncbi:UNVERIFIED_CONTAM: hypothetical protein PYX00_002404 [Menopon gallinae]|uniref:Mitochondrial inner membrane protein Mpv17 n=1 Tax=Menopon gallinae TaxID=328185 RepID=A0AAW2IIS5_9NEOP
MIFRIAKNLSRLRNVPYRREALQAGALMATGDLIAQCYVEKKEWKKVDVERTEKFFLIGAFVIGPPLGKWYSVLHRIFGKGVKFAALKKVTIDQLLFAPIFTGMVLSVINFTNHFSVESMIAKVKEDYPDVIKNNYKVWPAVQLFNFYMVPLKYQVFAVQIVAILWNTYISWKTNFVKPKD